MSDYAARLRNLADTLDSCEWEHPLGSADLCRETAYELKRLHKKLRRLRRSRDFYRHMHDCGLEALEIANRQNKRLRKWEDACRE